MFCHKHIITSSFTLSKYRKAVKQVQTAYTLLLTGRQSAFLLCTKLQRQPLYIHLEVWSRHIPTLAMFCH